MIKFGVIGGSGFYEFPELGNSKKVKVSSFYAPEKITLLRSEINEHDVYFMPRHGDKHNIPPHKINYRANIDAFATLGVSHILGVNAVGGITHQYGPGKIAFPNQIDDYTFGREHTFYDGIRHDIGLVEHVDFTYPMSDDLHTKLIQVATDLNIDCSSGGTYACMQGPRLETAAEIRRLKHAGNDMVGMTVMPEASLARERNIAYQSICLSVNWAAGIRNEVITMDAILNVLNSKMPQIRELILKTINSF